MALVINTNVASLNAQNNLTTNENALNQSLSRLSSGLRINSSADDPAGLAIATKFGAQVNGLNQAVRNANNATALLQTAAGGASTLTNMLQTLRTLAVQASSDDNTASDRSNLQQEATNLQTEITRIATTTQYNTQNLLDGSFTGKYFQIGANYGQDITFNIGNAQASGLGGRAQISAQIADGTTNSLNDGLGASALKINGTSVAATSSSSDQYSVLQFQSSVSVTTSTLSAGVLSLYINSTNVAINFVSNETQASYVTDIVSDINAAAITNVSATVVGSAWVLTATGGTDLTLAVTGSYAGGAALTSTQALAALGMSGFSTNIGYASVVASAYFNANGQSSAIAKAAAINAVQSTTSVSATSEANAITGSSAISAGSIASGDLYINGVNIGAVTTTTNDGTGALVSAINSVESQTGVTANTTSGGDLILSAADGRNITVTQNQSSTPATSTLGLNATYFSNGNATFRSVVQLNSQSAINLTGNLATLETTASVSGTANPTAAQNMAEATQTSQNAAVDTTDFNVSLLNISTQTGAEAAILTIDSALNQLNSINANIGAVQNRLGFTISNLQTGSQNMSSAQATIMDADFASETANFQKNQILVQAGVAMIAQANTLPQIALQLLK